MNYYYLSNNSEVVITMYDRKSKESGKNVYKISEVNKSGNSMSSTLNFNVYDEKGKTITNGAGRFKCHGASIDVDMRMSMPNDQMQTYKDMEIKAADAYLSYPSSMNAGQSLPDGNFSMEVTSKGNPFSTVTYNVVNRKVTGKEAVSSPAGNWEGYKITSNATMRIKMMGVGIPMNLQITEWFVPGFGVVKTETYNKNGKLMGSTLLTSIKK
jgi:hypothetical protein